MIKCKNQKKILKEPKKNKIKLKNKSLLKKLIMNNGNKF